MPFAFITRFDQKAIADDSDTDLYLLEFDISVQCLLNAAYLSELNPVIRGLTENPAEIMRSLYTRLMARGKDLSYKFDGKELIPKTKGNTGTRDAKNGPIPQGCTIIEAGEETFLLSYQIKASYWVNTVLISPEDQEVDGALLIENQTSNPVLSHRWDETVVHDNCEVATRTRNGTMIIRSDNTEGLIADQVRTQLAVLAVPDGFLRDRYTYGISRNGLSLTYTIVDKEVFRVPPKPAYEASGTVTETMQKGGAMRWIDVTVNLKGAIDTSQRKLLDEAIGLAVVASYMKGQRRGTFSGFLGVANTFINDLSSMPVAADAEYNIFENKVRFHLKTMFAVKNTVAYGLSHFDSMNTQLPWDDNYMPPYRVRGTSNLLLQTAAYYDPNVVKGNSVQETDPVFSSDNKPFDTNQGLFAAARSAVSKSPNKAVGRGGKST